MKLVDENFIQPLNNVLYNGYILEGTTSANPQLINYIMAIGNQLSGDSYPVYFNLINNLGQQQPFVTNTYTFLYNQNGTTPQSYNMSFNYCV